MSCAAPAVLLAAILASAQGPAPPPLVARGRTLSHWLDTLSEPTSPADERWLASEVLAELLVDPESGAAAREAAVPALRRAVEGFETQPLAAARAAELLALLGRDAAPAREALLTVLSRNLHGSAGRQIQVAAARALRGIGELPPAGGFVLARTAVTARSPAVRAAALDALAHLAPHRESVPLLADALTDASGEVRWTAACALAEIGAPAKDALPALRTALEGAPRAQSRFLDWVQQVFPRYSDDYRTRAAAAAALLAVGDPEAGLGALQSHLQHEDWLVRQAALDAVFAARRAGPDVVLPLLQYGLHDPSPPVRGRAATLLGRLGAEAAPLAGELGRRAAEDPDPYVREASLEAAVALTEDAATAVALLAGRLTDPAVSLRIRVVGQLARRVDAPGARAALRRAVDDPDPSVRRAAEQALELHEKPESP